MLHLKVLRGNQEVESPEPLGIFDRQLKVEKGYTPPREQKSAEPADSKRVEVFRWCKRVRKRLKEKKLELKHSR